MSFVPHTPDEIKEMLGAIGAKSIEELFQAIPAELRLKKLLNLPGPMSEFEVSAHIKALAGKNISTEQPIRPGHPGGYVSFLGAGCYNHYIPAVVNHLAGRSEFYTSYTPYQAEASQGNLTAFFEYQTMVCELTGMEAANASVYDGATALAEAVLMSLAVTGKKKVVVSKTIHPEYRQVLHTYLKDLPVRTGDSPGGNAEIIEVNYDKNGQTDLNLLQKVITPDIACVAIQNPNFFGIIEECNEISKLTHKEKALLIAVVNPISLGILKSPGEYNADIAVGEGQPLGNEMYFGGPHLGLFAAKMAYVRKMPGRLVGQTVDKDGKRGFVLTLSTREQHIRREKATSNICSNEALLALRAGIYLSAIGKQGIKKLANLCLQKAHYAADAIKSIKGYELVFNSPFFHEFVIRSPIKASILNQKLLAEGIIGGLDLEQFYPELKNTLLFCTTEVNSKSDIDRLVAVLKK
jgi:glycine dehydrogenase subunit 1